MNTKPKRLYELDLVRFFAALIVVLFHYTTTVQRDYGFHLIKNNFITRVFGYGNLGVQLFFIISGFVILMSAQNITANKFAKLRAIRLYPAFVPICFVTWVLCNLFLQKFAVGVKDFLINVSLIGIFNTWFGGKLVSGVYWTLRVEMQFYFFIFLIIYFKKINSIRTILFGWFILSIITQFGQWYFNSTHIFNKLWMLFITDYSYYFIAGCFFYLIKYSRQKFDWIMPILCFIMAAVTYHFPRHNTYIAVTVISLFFALFYYISYNDISINKGKKLLESLGGITYPLYLMHELFELVFFSFLIAYLNHTLLYCLAVVLMIALSYGVYRFIEKPIIKKLRSF